jgi:hypothetical protein
VGLRSSDSGDAVSFGKEGIGGRYTRLAEPASPEDCPPRSMSDLAQLSHLDTYVPGDMRHTGSWEEEVTSEPVAPARLKGTATRRGTGLVKRRSAVFIQYG